jgi:hypothetical protein
MKKNQLRTHHHSYLDTTPPPGRIYWDDSNSIAKDYMSTPKQIAYAVREVTWRANQNKLS